MTAKRVLLSPQALRDAALVDHLVGVDLALFSDAGRRRIVEACDGLRAEIDAAIVVLLAERCARELGAGVLSAGVREPS